MVTSSSADGCVFCAIVRRDAEATVRLETSQALIIEPLQPVVAGHLLVLPKTHVKDAGEIVHVTADVFALAANYARAQYASYNLITSAGSAATQTVFHLHVHIVPREAGDGLALPWAPNVAAQFQRSAPTPWRGEPAGGHVSVF